MSLSKLGPTRRAAEAVVEAMVWGNSMEAVEEVGIAEGEVRVVAEGEVRVMAKGEVAAPGMASRMHVVSKRGVLLFFW